MRQLKVVVAYGDIFYYEAAIERLRIEGYQVFTAKSKKEVLDIFAREQPDCFITGVELAFRDGDDLIDIAQRQYPDMKIIATSTGEPENDEKKYRKSGVPFLAIPYRPVKLLNLLKKLFTH